ncbi:MAG: hypothetical protein H6912_10270 [Kordiimonadaceae bacterium]|nr:hypothetical protein [Kordiimonadaceae bacterium]
MKNEQEKGRVEYVVHLEVRVLRQSVKWYEKPSIRLGFHLVLTLLQLLA